MSFNIRIPAFGHSNLFAFSLKNRETRRGKKQQPMSTIILKIYLNEPIPF
jgi:hypothetical protein